MVKIHTHYDNLMVSRNAPPEVIRASYLTLSKKFHPDVNNSDSALRIMKIINISYDILSNPDKRKNYDIFLRMEEYKMSQASNHQTNYSQKPKDEEKKKTYFLKRTLVVAFNLIKKIFVLSLKKPREAVFLGIALWIGSLFIDNEIKPVPTKTSYASVKNLERDKAQYHKSIKNIEKEKRKYKRPNSAPNGSVWPVASGYIKGYKRLNYKGKSTIQVKNFQNENDFYLKLVDRSRTNATAVRHVLVKAKGNFTLQGVSAGKYQLMYFDIDSGLVTKSEEFEVKEIKTKTHISSSDMRITLYKVPHGNFRSEGISLDEFMGVDS